MDPYSYRLLSRAYSAFIAPGTAVTLDYLVTQRDDQTIQIGLKGNPVDTAGNDYELLYSFEKSITIELQKLRKELLFIHAAALEHGGRTSLLIAPSGSGKSTTTWALLNNGFKYLSDELAPIDLNTLKIHLYPHALCLKAPPPQPFFLPEGTLHTAHTIHVPVDLLPGEVCQQPSPLGAVFFLRYDPDAVQPSATPISKAAAGARIYSNALNLLAHSRYGLDAAVTIADNSACFELVTNDLQKSCALIKSVLADI